MDASAPTNPREARAMTDPTAGCRDCGTLTADHEPACLARLRTAVMALDEEHEVDFSTPFRELYRAAGELLDALDAE